MDAPLIHFFLAAGQVLLVFVAAFVAVCAVVILQRVYPDQASTQPPAPGPAEAFQAQARALQELALRSRESLSLIAVQDEAGKPLSEYVVRTLRQAIRGNDLSGWTAAGSWAVLARAGSDRAAVLADRLRGLAAVSHGIRVGVAPVPADCRDLPAWLEKTMHAGEASVLSFKSQASPYRELPGGWKDVAMPHDLEQALGRFITAHQQDPRGVSVLRLDIDHFKVYSEQHGPRAGGDIVQQLGAVVRRNVRLTDVVAHARDDEFVLLIPGSSEQARCAALRLLGLIRKATFPVAGHEFRLTVSFGIASYPVHSMSTAELLNLSEVALRSAKERGRNTLMIYDRGLAAAQPDTHVRDTL